MATANNVNNPAPKREAARKTCPSCATSVANRTIACPTCGYNFITKTMPFVEKGPKRQPKAVIAAKVKEPQKMPEITTADFLNIDITDLSKLRERMVKFPLEFYQRSLAAIDQEGVVEKLKMELAKIEVESDAKVRKEFTDKGVKFTEKVVENAVILEESVVTARNALLEARLELRKQKAIVDATEALGKILLGLSDEH